MRIIPSLCRNLIYGSILLLIVLVTTPFSMGQTLRFSNHRKLSIPEYALLRIGPFYSNMTFSQSIGYSYTRSSGTGTDFLFDNGRGVIKKDGQEFPMVSTLDTRNYLLITPQMDLDISLRISYSHYPLKTQEDEFLIDMSEEGIYGNLSTDFFLTPFVRGLAYDSMVYKTDYIDTRGIIDEYGGEQYEYFNNNVGIDIDWLMKRDKNLAISVKRTDALPKTDGFEDQKSISYSESVTYEHQLALFLSLGLNGSFQQSFFTSTNRADLFLQTYSINSGFMLTRKTSGNASIGYTIASISLSPEQKDGIEEDGSSASGSVSLETKFSSSLKHSIIYSRSIQGGFNSAYNINDDYGYRINWTGKAVTCIFSSALSFVDPGKEWLGQYRNWANSITVFYPFVRFASLTMSSSYTIRRNKNVYIGAESEEEWVNDYNTWSSSIGTSFSITSNIKFFTSAEHIERYSESENLRYKRDVLKATFVYSHRF